MECILSGSQFRSFCRAVNSLAKVGTELLVEGVPNKLILRALNAARSSFLEIIYRPQFFDHYQLSTQVAQCSILLKSVCTVFRTPASNIERLTIVLATDNASKVQWTLDCSNGIRKTYWTSCTYDCEILQAAIDRNAFPSHLIVKPKDLNRLLSNFQSSLHEMTIIATEPDSTLPEPDAPEAKAVEMRSYVDPAKETTDGALHTQLWIDPAEEFQEYTHAGEAVDVTFGIKELKSMIAFCEGSEADMHMYFDKAGSPVLFAPRFALDDSEHSDFDAALVLATMVESQLRPASDTPAAAPPGNPASRTTPQGGTNGMHSERTNLWSEVSGSGARTAAERGSNTGAGLVGSEPASEELPAQPARGQQQGPESEPIHESAAHVRVQPGSFSGGHQEQRGHASELPVRNDAPVSNDSPPPLVRKRRRHYYLDDDDDEEQGSEDDEDFVRSTPPEERGKGF